MLVYKWRTLYEEPYMPHETMLERIVDSSFSSINIHEFVYDNQSLFRSMIIDVMRMDYSYLGEGLYNIFLDEEPNIYRAMLF